MLRKISPSYKNPHPTVHSSSNRTPSLPNSAFLFEYTECMVVLAPSVFVTIHTKKISACTHTTLYLSIFTAFRNFSTRETRENGAVERRRHVDKSSDYSWIEESLGPTVNNLLLCLGYNSFAENTLIVKCSAGVPYQSGRDTLNYGKCAGEGEEEVDGLSTWQFWEIWNGNWGNWENQNFFQLQKQEISEFSKKYFWKMEIEKFGKNLKNPLENSYFLRFFGNCPKTKFFPEKPRKGQWKTEKITKNSIFRRCSPFFPIFLILLAKPIKNVSSRFIRFDSTTLTKLWSSRKESGDNYRGREVKWADYPLRGPKIVSFLVKSAKIAEKMRKLQIATGNMKKQTSSIAKLNKNVERRFFIKNTIYSTLLYFDQIFQNFQKISHLLYTVGIVSPVVSRCRPRFRPQRVRFRWPFRFCWFCHICQLDPLAEREEENQQNDSASRSKSMSKMHMQRKKTRGNRISRSR